MSARCAASSVTAVAGAALVLIALAGCSGTSKDKPTATGVGGDAIANDAGGGETPAVGAAGSGAGGSQPSPDDTAGAGGATDSGVAGAPPQTPETPAYAGSVESFEPGAGAGFNQPKLPDIVLGPPKGKGTSTGSLDVVSLGAGGTIVLGFGALGIVDGPGADLIVFENPFWPGGDATKVFAELAEVSVSEDGKTWQTFPCDVTGDGLGNFKGCAGVTPTLVYDPATLIPLDPKLSGGDAFDLADLGLKSARFVKIHDLETHPPAGNTTGFDLDAVGVIHAQ